MEGEILAGIGLRAIDPDQNFVEKINDGYSAML